MREIQKRWTRVGSKSGTTGWVLKEIGGGWNRAVIKLNPISDEWRLLIWGDGDWGNPVDVKTLRAAKALGRILAASANI